MNSENSIHSETLQRVSMFFDRHTPTCYALLAVLVLLLIMIVIGLMKEKPEKSGYGLI